MQNSVTILGKGGISASLIEYTQVPNGTKLSTYELIYPRTIHSEVMTHCMLAKNAASTRAVPIASVINEIRKNPARPIHWGMNQPGMQSRQEIEGSNLDRAMEIVNLMQESVIQYVEELSRKDGINGHKQWVGRYLESFTMMKTVLSGTEMNNLKWLRKHDAAQPEFNELSTCMDEASTIATPRQLLEGQWHLPYIDQKNGKFFSNGIELTLDEARMVSASCCGQVSYRKLDQSKEKAIDIFMKLSLDSPDPEARQHASPTEHQAMAMHLSKMTPFDPETWEPGVTHVKRDGSLWSAKFRSYVQNRHLYSGESVPG